MNGDVVWYYVENSSLTYIFTFFLKTALDCAWVSLSQAPSFKSLAMLPGLVGYHPPYYIPYDCNPGVGSHHPHLIVGGQHTSPHLLLRHITKDKPLAASRAVRPIPNTPSLILQPAVSPNTQGLPVTLITDHASPRPARGPRADHPHLAYIMYAADCLTAISNRLHTLNHRQHRFTS